MRFMNDYDIDTAQRRFDPHTTPNRAEVAAVIIRLADWANKNSDGWAYWPKPAHAAAKAMALIDGTTWAEREEQETTDCTDAEFKAALAPIKSFLTRQGVSHIEVI